LFLAVEAQAEQHASVADFSGLFTISNFLFGFEVARLYFFK